MLDKVEYDIQHLESPTCKEEFKMILLNGPFGVELNYILRRATRLCVWGGPSFTRNRSIVTEAKKKITSYACEELGKEIIETVVHNLKFQLGSDNFDVFGVICQHIYLEDFKTTILKHILLILLNLFLGWVINVVLILIAGVNINSDAFRNDLARNMYDQIYQNKDKIISEVVDEICSTALQKYKDLEESLTIAGEELHNIIIENGKDKIENEFRRITKINERITDCKFEHGSLKIYARGYEKYYTEIKEFVDTYYRPDVVTEIIMDKKNEGR
ncbi:SMC4 [Mytilus edulis]|uniref:SMC4 n=1 Tax=Mytilus edulis TaxID=6550 RepID=A0A8S3S8C6_MYTED|nr:SMC4 [Mytilus edulis]